MLIDLGNALRQAGVSAHGAAAVVVVVVPLATAPPAKREVQRWGGDPAQRAQALEFFDSLLAGGVATQPVALPARSDDLHRWYALWCLRRGCSALAQNRFVHALKQGGRVAVRSMRIRSEHGPKQPAIVFAVSGGLQAHSAARAALAQCIGLFSEGLERYAQSSAHSVAPLI